MDANLNSVRKILESCLKEAAPSSGLRESIRIHQAADPVDMTQQAAEREMAIRSLHRDSELARRLRWAMERLDNGSYGTCVQCEESISPKRLSAIPWAELCIHCQAQADGEAVKNAPIPSFELRQKAA